MSQPRLTRQFLQNRQALLGFIFALTRDQRVAEEVFQEVALAILEEAAGGKEVEPFLPWAREVARRRVAEHYRKASRREAPAPLDESMVEVVCRAFDENDEAPEKDSLRLAFLRQCLRQLPRRARDVIERRYSGRMDIETIAQGIAWQVDSVHVLLARTRKALAECIRAKLATMEAS
jgi:RNA polymerase sigma factor (sigma-70 family)